VNYQVRVYTGDNMFDTEFTVQAEIPLAPVEMLGARVVFFANDRRRYVKMILTWQGSMFLSSEKGPTTCPKRGPLWV
jgi:hypothetical protein